MKEDTTLTKKEKTSMADTMTTIGLTYQEKDGMTSTNAIPPN